MGSDEEEEEMTVEQKKDLRAIRLRKKKIVTEHRVKKGVNNNKAVLKNRASAEGRLTAAAMKKSLGAMGIDTGAALQRARSESRGRKRDRSESRGRAQASTRRCRMGSPRSACTAASPGACFGISGFKVSVTLAFCLWGPLAALSLLSSLFAVT